MVATKAPRFGAKRCQAKGCDEWDCLRHIPVEADYPASAWDIEAHDYGPRVSATGRVVRRS